MKEFYKKLIHLKKSLKFGFLEVSKSKDEIEAAFSLDNNFSHTNSRN